MKNNKLPFQIGKHYENWEFDLEPIEKERILGFDSYIYFRELLFLSVIPRYVELIFSWDISACPRPRAPVRRSRPAARSGNFASGRLAPPG